MAVIAWDQVGERVYEAGLDRGVLYLPNGSAVPWNGLTSVIEHFDSDNESIYYDGRKINEIISLGSFSATMTAVTYPDEFAEIEGSASVRRGAMVMDQTPQTFSLCYRTMIGNDFDGDVSAYKIHIVYNVVAVPSDKTYASLSDDPSLVEFEWELRAIPEDIPGFRPTAHLVLDSRDFDPWLLSDIEKKLYGTSITNASLVPMAELAEYIRGWYRFRVVDNGDGTATITSLSDEGIIFTNEEYGRISNVVNGRADIIGIYAILIEQGIYELQDTDDVWDVPDIKIIDHGDGTWSAETAHDNMIFVDEEFMFEIINANAIYLDEHTYQVEDTMREG